MQNRITILHADLREVDAQIRDAFIRSGFICSLLDVDTIDYSLLTNGTVIINRVYPSDEFERPGITNRTIIVLETLQKNGFEILNSLIAARCDYSKLYSANLMKQKCVRTPETIMYEGQANALSFPLVVKLDTGGFGKEATIIRSDKEWRDYFQNCDWKVRPRIIQVFEQSSLEFDYRLTVLFGEVIFGYTRTLADGWIGSTERGSQLKILDSIPREVASLAIGASKAISADINGVDIVMTQNGPVVIENNPTPAFSRKTWSEINIDPVQTLVNSFIAWTKNRKDQGVIG